MDPEAAKAIREIAGQAGQTFQSVSTPEVGQVDKAKLVNETLAKTQFLSQEAYFNPDRINEYGRRDAGPGEIELFDPDTRMAVARVAREPKITGPKIRLWQSNNYNSKQEYDQVDKGNYISLIDPTTNREVARASKPSGGADDGGRPPEPPTTEGGGPPENPFDRFSYAQLEQTLIQKKDALTKSERDMSVNPALARLPRYREGADKLRQEISLIQESRDRLLQDPEAAEIIPDFDALVEQETDYRLREGQPFSTATGPEGEAYEKLQAYLEAETEDLPNIFSNPRLEGALKARYEVLMRDYRSQFPDQLNTTTATPETPPEPPTPPVIPPDAPPAPPITEDEVSEENLPNEMLFTDLYDSLQRLQAQKEAHERLNARWGGRVGPEIESQIVEFRNAYLELRNLDGAREIFDFIDSIITREIDHIRIYGSGTPTDEDYLNDREYLKDLLSVDTFLNNPRLKNAIKHYYQREKDRLSKDLGTGDADTSMWEKFNYKYAEQLKRDFRGFIDREIELIETNQKDSKQLRAILGEMEVIASNRPKGFNQAEVDQYLEVVWLTEARLCLYDAQKTVPTIGDTKLDKWAESMSALLGTEQNSVAFYLRWLLGEKTDGNNFERVERVPFLNTIVDYLKDAEIADDSTLDISGHPIIKNFYQFGPARPERDRATSLFIEHLLNSTTSPIKARFDTIRNQITEQLSTDEHFQELSDEDKSQKIRQELEKHKEYKQMLTAVRLSDFLYRATLLSTEMNPPLLKTPPAGISENNLAARAKQMPRLTGNDISPELKLGAKPGEYTLTASNWDNLLQNLDVFDYGDIKNGLTIRAGAGNDKLKSILYTPVTLRASGQGVSQVQHLAFLRRQGLLTFLHNAVKAPNGTDQQVTNFDELLKAFQVRTAYQDITSTRVGGWIKSIKDGEDKVKKFYESGTPPKGIIFEPISAKNRIELLKISHEIEVAHRKPDHTYAQDVEIWRRYQSAIKDIVDPITGCLECYSNLPDKNFVYLLYLKDNLLKFLQSPEAEKIIGITLGPISSKYFEKVFYLDPQVRYLPIRPDQLSGSGNADNVLSLIKAKIEELKGYSQETRLTPHTINQAIGAVSDIFKAFTNQSPGKK